MDVRAKTSKKRVVLGIVIFLLCAGLLFCYLNKVFSMGDSDANRQTFKAFYAEPKNTIDVMYLGTSASNRYFIDFPCFFRFFQGQPFELYCVLDLGPFHRFFTFPKSNVNLSGFIDFLKSKFFIVRHFWKRKTPDFYTEYWEELFFSFVLQQTVKARKTRLY